MYPLIDTIYEHLHAHNPLIYFSIFYLLLQHQQYFFSTEMGYSSLFHSQSVKKIAKVATYVKYMLLFKKGTYFHSPPLDTFKKHTAPIY